MLPLLVDFGAVQLHSFGAMMALAFLVAGYVVSLELARRRLDPEFAWSIILWAAMGGLIGARLLVIASDWEGFLDRPIAFLLSASGFIWYGGLVGGFLSVSILIRRRGLSFWAVADSAAPALALGHAIGRIGCQVSGDGDWGLPTDLPWAMSYSNAVIGWEAWTAAAGLQPEVTVHPAPVYEILLYTGIFLLLWSVRRGNLAAGSMLWLYLVLSSVARFGVEAIRIEPVVALGLTQAQWIAMGLVLAGATRLAVSRRPGGARSV